MSCIVPATKYDLTYNRINTSGMLNNEISESIICGLAASTVCMWCVCVCGVCVLWCVCVCVCTCDDIVRYVCIYNTIM